MSAAPPRRPRKPKLGDALPAVVRKAQENARQVRDAAKAKKEAEKEKRGKRGRRPRDRDAGGRPMSTAPGPLTPMGATGPKGHEQAAAELERQARRALCASMLVEGFTYREIADKLGCSVHQVSDDLKQTYDELNLLRLTSVEHRRLLEINRTERNDRKILPGLDDKDPRVRNQTSDALRANAEFRARLDGLYAKPDGMYTEAEVLTMMQGLTRGLLAEFTDREHRVRILSIYRRQSGKALPEGNQTRREAGDTTDGRPTEQVSGGRDEVQEDAGRGE